MQQFLLQQTPVVVDLAEAPARAARDISIDVVIGIFTLAGMVLLVAALGSLLVAGAIILVKRWRDSTSGPGDGAAGEPSHTRLRI